MFKGGRKRISYILCRSESKVNFVPFEKEKKKKSQKSIEKLDTKSRSSLFLPTLGFLYFSFFGTAYALGRNEGLSFYPKHKVKEETNWKSGGKKKRRSQKPGIRTLVPN